MAAIRLPIGRRAELPTVLAASSDSAPNCTVNCTQHGTPAAICRSKGEPRLLYLTIAEARIVLLIDSGLRHNGQAHFNAMSDEKKYLPFDEAALHFFSPFHSRRQTAS